MTAEQGLIRDNISLLRQGLQVIESISDATYTAEASAALSSAAKHFRHIFNHYDALVSRGHRAVDYETRERGTEIERDRGVALRKASALISQLEDMTAGPADTLLRVERIIRGGDGQLHAMSYPSSLARELDFIHQHTVHHYAMIALILLHHGINVDPEFGMSPSTRRFVTAAEQR